MQTAQEFLNIYTKRLPYFLQLYNFNTDSITNSDTLLDCFILKYCGVKDAIDITHEISQKIASNIEIQGPIDNIYHLGEPSISELEETYLLRVNQIETLIDSLNKVLPVALIKPSEHFAKLWDDERAEALIKSKKEQPITSRLRPRKNLNYNEDLLFFKAISSKATESTEDLNQIMNDTTP